MFDIPVVLIVFNRPEETRLLIKTISKIEPKNIFVISDGPREGNSSDNENVSRVRDLFSSEEIYWECNVRTNFSESNLGCQKRVSTGLDWVFSAVESAIILEDDCIPSLTFFDFCEKYLDEYADDERYMSISGTRLSPIKNELQPIFSKYSICWGWATWGRAWKKYDFNLSDFDDLSKRDFFRYHLGGVRPSLYWKYIFSCVVSGNINSWAYRWMLSCWKENGLSIVPPKNLISNVGHGEDATHTKDLNAFLNKESHGFEVSKLNTPYLDYKSDKWIEDNFYSKSIIGRLRWLLNKVTKNAHGKR